MELKPQHHPKLRNLGALCAVALLSICAMVGLSYAQTSTAASDSSGSTIKPKTSSPKKSVKKPAKSSAAKTSTSPSHAQAHPGSHPSSSKTKSANASAAHGSSKRAASRKSSKRKTARGQQKIEPERAEAIQEALIREHYLSGEAAGTWNQASEDAMRKYQADHGWQSKTVPDARALISLGLGPSHDHLLNPDSAMTTGPAGSRAASLTPVSHSADPGARMSTSQAPVADSGQVTTSDPEAAHPQ